MTQFLLRYLCEPFTKENMTLVNTQIDEKVNIISGELKNSNGKIYPIVNGIPRFVDGSKLKKSVESFGDEWNLFNFDTFKIHWFNHTIKNTFGTRRYSKIGS